MPEIALKKRFKYAGDVFAALMKKGWPCTEASEFVNSFRDADVEEVVRCQDCKHWYKSKKFSPFGWCCQRSDLAHVSYRDRTNPEDFCSKGERRTDENN